AQPKHPEKLIKQLRSIFEQQLAPLARQMRQSGDQMDLRFRKTSSTWIPFNLPCTFRECFEFSLDVDTPNPDPGRFADALLCYCASAKSGNEAYRGGIKALPPRSP